MPKLIDTQVTQEEHDLLKDIEESGEEITDKCSHDHRLACESCYNEHWLSGLNSGIEKGIEHAADYVRERAVKLFMEKKDGDAVALRSLADTMVKDLATKLEKKKSR